MSVRSDDWEAICWNCSDGIFAYNSISRRRSFSISIDMRRKSYAMSETGVARNLRRSHANLASPYPDHFLQRTDKNLAIANLPGPCARNDRVNRRLNLLIPHNNGQQIFAVKINSIFVSRDRTLYGPSAVRSP